MKKIHGLGHAQVEECLPSKLKALSSNPSTAKKKKKNHVVNDSVQQFCHPKFLHQSRCKHHSKYITEKPGSFQ
jgi:hypothetical protein